MLPSVSKLDVCKLVAMINKKILIVSSYPIKNPVYGGQKRANATFEFYKTIFSEVKFVAVFQKDFYQDYGADDIYCQQLDIVEKIFKMPYASDLISGKAIKNDVYVRSRMANLLREYKPDIIQIEQIYPYLGLEPLLRELNLTPKIILSSHNIESRMKVEIYKSLKLPTRTRATLSRQIEQLESKISRDADLTIAISAANARAHKSMGAKRCIVIPNGPDKVAPSCQAVLFPCAG